MAVLDSIKKAVQGTAASYQSDKNESKGLGEELKMRKQQYDLGAQALGGSPKSEPAKPAAPSKPAKQDLVKPGAKYGDRPGEQRLDSEGNVIKSMKKGGEVKKTGLYKLHEGEEVVPKAQAALGKKKKGSGKVPHKMTIRKMDDDSFHITHDHQSPTKNEMGTTPPQEEFTVPNAKHLVRHVRQTYNAPQEMPGEE
jgi:hypothetical protein